MPRPISSVQLDIARFGWEVSKLKTDRERAEWLEKFAEALVMRDHQIHKYAGTLLDEADEFIQSKSQKARESAARRWENEGKQDKNAIASDRMQPHNTASDGMRSDATEYSDHSEHTYNNQEGGLMPKGKGRKLKTDPIIPLAMTSNPELMAAYMGFKEMRKKIKKPMTERAERRLIAKLKELSGGSSKKAIAILEKSEDKNWMDIYPIDAEAPGGFFRRGTQAPGPSGADIEFLQTGTD